jgi:penicillin amidase
MPAWRPPPAGFVVNANNLPIGRAYPVKLPRYEWPHDRALRIAERLEADSSVTIDDMRSVQNDVVSRAAARLVPLLVAAADSVRESLDARERAALDTLRAWDFAARRERVAPTLYRAWYGALQRRSRLEGLMGLAQAALDGRAPEALRAPGKESPERAAVAAREALRLAMVELGKKLGPDLAKWRWERAHLARFPNAMGLRDTALATRPVGIDGDNATPSVAPSALPWRLSVAFAPVFRHVVDLASPDSSLGIVTPGNSGVGKHRDDLVRRWANHGYVRLDLDWARIEENRESEWRLEPRLP